MQGHLHQTFRPFQTQPSVACGEELCATKITALSAAPGQVEVMGEWNPDFLSPSGKQPNLQPFHFISPWVIAADRTRPTSVVCLVFSLSLFFFLSFSSILLFLSVVFSCFRMRHSHSRLDSNYSINIRCRFLLLRKADSNHRNLTLKRNNNKKRWNCHLSHQVSALVVVNSTPQLYSNPTHPRPDFSPSKTTSLVSNLFHRDRYSSYFIFFPLSLARRCPSAVQ